jgi:hypothetical protein
LAYFPPFRYILPRVGILHPEKSGNPEQNGGKMPSTLGQLFVKVGKDERRRLYQ